jgi:FlaA1/EpsC-like NDP-sugar epimerase
MTSTEPEQIERSTPEGFLSENIFDEKTVAVTGGTGSFGHFITRELLKSNAREILIFSRDEEKQLEMKRVFPDPRLHFVIGDVRDYDRVVEATQTDYLYHAAALKIIPTCEENPGEVYKTNVKGTLNVKNACVRNRVEKAILISTDKAVKPVNTYGMTKALAERLWLGPELAVETAFSVVRYGNVMGSRGSIIPFFKQLISQREPLPITHRAMSRFWLTLRQAIDLVFYATDQMQGGEIFVPRIPASLIVDLAKALAGDSYPTREVGIRPGEKIVETLISEEEIRRTEERKSCFVIHPYGRYVNNNPANEYTSASVRQLSVPEIRALLKEVDEVSRL